MSNKLAKSTKLEGKFVKAMVKNRAYYHTNPPNNVVNPLQTVQMYEKLNNWSKDRDED